PLAYGSYQQFQSRNDFFIRIYAKVIGTYHDVYFASLVTIQFIMIYAPKHVFYTIISKAQVPGSQGIQYFFP
ncbi:hypothetical protein, partial [Pseudoxanthomonas sp. KAs_5_3]|uniref:hypothetical protein n=1 Tax=Pseudoxanthomonas sp. KAs_5_3 TaxID=2067658 RepID=UPI001E611F9D